MTSNGIVLIDNCIVIYCTFEHFCGFYAIQNKLLLLFIIYCYFLQWFPLDNVKTGLIHVRATWFHLSKDPADLERVNINALTFCDI